MQYYGTITINGLEAKMIQRILTEEPQNEKIRFTENEIISHSVIFENGLEMQLQVTGVPYDAAKSNLAIAYATLLKNGVEVLKTQNHNRYDGEWAVDYDNNQYVVVVNFC